MKEIKLIILFLFTYFSLFSQRMAYVDTDYILQKIPKYKEAQSQLDKMAREWQIEIDAEKMELRKFIVSLENERILLTKDLIDERETQILEKTASIDKLQQKRFGAEGDLITQRKQLVKPIQDQIFNAVHEISKRKHYDFVFDKSSDLIMLYYNKKYDISDKVLKKIKNM